jgi:hypothetical protein
MDDIKPTIISDEEILCSQEECPQWYDERYCRITDDRTPYICTPWFMNEVKQLRAQLDRALEVLVFDRTAEYLVGYDKDEVEIAMANRKKYIMEGE